MGRSVRKRDGQRAVGVEGEPPATFVGTVMVFHTERKQILDVSRPEVTEEREVMDDDVVSGDLA